MGIGSNQLGNGGSGVSDHGGLTGLGDDDHSQYHNDSRGDARYTQKSNNLSDLASASTARTNLGVSVGSDVQAYDADLGTIAGLDSSTSGAIASDGAGWIKKTYAQFKTALSLVKGDVGLGSVDNTSDANKPVSTATQTALDGKVDENSAITGATKTKITYDAKGLVTAGADATQDDIGDGSTNKQYSATEKTKLAGIETGADVTDSANVDSAGAVMNSDTSTASMNFVVDEDDMTSNSATKVPTQQSTKAYVDAQIIGSGSGDVVGPASATDENPAVFDGTTGKLIKETTYSAFKTALALVKGDVGLGNVDNTSDATKNSASVTLTNKNLTSSTNTFPNGHAVQFVYTNYSATGSTTTTIPLDSTIPQNTEGAEFMSVSITPKATTNLLKIEATILLSSDTASRWLIAALFQDSTANALAANPTFMATANGGSFVSIAYTMVAGTTSATTFKIRAGAHGAGTTHFNQTAGGATLGAIVKSSIQVTEYKAT